MLTVESLQLHSVKRESVFHLNQKDFGLQTSFIQFFFFLIAFSLIAILTCIYVPWTLNYTKEDLSYMYLKLCSQM